MKVFVTARVPEEVRSLLSEHHEVEAHDRDQPLERATLLERVRDKDGILWSSSVRVDDEMLEGAPKLRMIANSGVGFDHIDVEAATRREILVSNTPGVLTDTTADLAMALLLSVSRRVVEGDRMVREGEFKFVAPLFFLGQEVSGKTLGIVGFGRIGRAVAKRAAGFDMKVIYYSRTRCEAHEEAKLGVAFAPLDELLRVSDFVSVHVPMGPGTRHLLGSRELALMKPTAFLINTARGPILDEVALVEALRKGVIGGAGLDVYENEPALTPGLAELKNTVLLPHVGSATVQTRTRMARLAAENLLAGLRGDQPPNCLNWSAITGRR